MADALFPKLKKKWANGSAAPDLDTDDIRVMLVASTYVYDPLVGGAVDDNAVFDANDSTLTATAATACNALIIFKHTGVDATAELIAYLDSVVGLPFTPEAAQVCPIVWSNGANKIFKI
jgi:hypothetical protein